MAVAIGEAGVGGASAGAASGTGECWPALTDGVAVLAAVGDRVHIGTSPERSVVASGPGESLAQWVRGVNGRRPLGDQIREAVRFGLNPGDARDLVRCLIEAGLADAQPPVMCRRPVAAVTVFGSTHACAALRRRLEAGGLRVTETVFDPDPHLWSRVDSHRLETVDASAGSIGPGDMAVVALRRSAPDAAEAALGDRLVSMDVPHLVVGSNPVARVGPLVVPGITPCLRCELHALGDLDRDWPVITLHWAIEAAPRPDPDVLDVAAQEAARWLLHADLDSAAFRDPDFRDASWDQVRETHGGGGPWWNRRPTRHPACGCAWAEMAEPSATASPME